FPRHCHILGRGSPLIQLDRTGEAAEPRGQNPMKLLKSASFAPLRRFCLVLAMLGLVLAAFGALAQEEENRALDAVRQSLDLIEQELSAGAFDDSDLVALAGRIAEARAAAAKVTESLAPRAQAITTRL